LHGSVLKKKRSSKAKALGTLQWKEAKTSKTLIELLLIDPDASRSQHRSPWYSQEEHEPPSFLCTYINRKSAANDQTFALFSTAQIDRRECVLAALSEKASGRSNQSKSGVDQISMASAQINQTRRTHWRKPRLWRALYKMERRELGNVSAEKIVSALPALSVCVGFQASFC
jgi:hypothetical protein